MATQIYAGKGFKATFKFNGIIDGQPQFTHVAPDEAAIFTMADPKTEQPAVDDPAKTDTLCVLHGWSTNPDFVGMVGINVKAVVDDPATANNTEAIEEEFADLVEYIAATAAKATSISVQVEEEVPPPPTRGGARR